MNYKAAPCGGVLNTVVLKQGAFTRFVNKSIQLILLIIR